jgi:hypothetical protein
MNRGGLSREGVIQPCRGAFFCEAATTPVELFADQIAHRPTAGSIRRRSLWISATWLRLRARRKPGMAIATSSTITATAIMISTSVNAVRANFVDAKPIRRARPEPKLASFKISFESRRCCNVREHVAKGSTVREKRARSCVQCKVERFDQVER